jgi:hypothetical protein
LAQKNAISDRFRKKAQYSDIRTEEMQLSRFVVNTFTLHHERTQSEARRIKLFVILLSLAKRENFSTPLPSSAQRTSTTLSELFRHSFVPLNFYHKKDSLTLIPFVFGTPGLAILFYCFFKEEITSKQGEDLKSRAHS